MAVELTSGSGDAAAPAQTARDLSADRIGRIIFEHAARISRERSISRLLVMNADLARDLTGADRCSVWLQDAKTDELWTKVAHGAEEIRITAGTGIVGACVASGEVMIVNEAVSDQRFLRRVDQTTGYRTESVLAVPLRADGAVLGALQVLNKPGGFAVEDAELLVFLASYAAAEIQAERLREEAERARLLRRELDLAREVQRNLLPLDPMPVSGIEYAGFCRPANFVGGDYYDFLSLGDEAFSLTIGDVSGKGVPAAVMMASIQTLLRSQMLRQPLVLGRVFEELNDTIYRCSTIDRYSTLFGGVLDAARGILTYVNAGHLYPALVSADGHFRRLEDSGFPIGLLPSIRYEQKSIAMKRGDLLVCISDGISEACDERAEMWDDGSGRLGVLLAENRHLPVAGLIETLVSAVDEYVGGAEQRDDITVVAVRIE